MAGTTAYVLAASVAVAVALVVYRRTVGDAEVEPEVPDADAWWGPAASRGNTAADIRPFRINVSDQVIEDLRNRLANARPAVRPLENVNFEYGFNGDHLAKIVDHWANRYDWTARQARLNALPQYMTNVFGLDVHFVHAKPAQPSKVRAVPLLLLHGWPGSVVEFYKMIPMLTAPRDGRDFAFEVIAPSMPGYGFSDAAVRRGLGPAQVGQVFVKLMERLGHEKFYVQGGDWGAIVTEAVSMLFPDRVYGMHSNMCTVSITSMTLCDYVRLALGSYWPSLIVSSEQEKSDVYPLSKTFSASLEETGYMHIQMTKPDTVGVALNDSPAGLAAYILEKFSTWTNSDYKHLPDGGLSKFDIDELLDNVMIYWVTGSITTSMRLYSEFASTQYQSLPHLRAKVKVPAACANFPHEIPIALRLKKLLKRKYTNLVRATEMKDGGHFAAFERPDLLAEDIWLTVFEMENIRNRQV